ncbi:MAG: hypothetical protein J0L56_18865 [Chitinophagales bacterium]|nr:hypothetical protein [Chitinophagales bacterium]
MLKDFNKNFGLSSSIESEKNAFYNRCSHFLQEIRQKALSQEDYRALFDTVCLQLGLNPRHIVENSSFLRTYVPDLHELLPDDFLGMLKIIAIVRKYYSTNHQMVQIIDETIEGFFDLSTTDIGITYKSGMFFPKGEELLDKELIGHSLTLLKSYPDEDKDLKTALDNYRSGTKYGVIEFSYRCIEGLARQILKNNRTLIDNKSEIIKASGLSDHWKKILANYIDYGNEYGRHASTKRHHFNESEVEAYLYTTCILVRLILKIKNTAT